MQSIDAKLVFTSLRLYVADMLGVAAAATRNGESPRWLTEQHNVAGRLQGKQLAQMLPGDIYMVSSKVCVAAWAGRVREHTSDCECLAQLPVVTRAESQSPWSPCQGASMALHTRCT